ncbi:MULTISPECIES: TRAP transporter large permease [Marinobacter]|uniref:TRAP transporter large permease n=1 Tax=Marinobacter TaxID=2742 RepID=UPI001AFF9F19|nr:TRAP transporter large permease [Marinobacter sp.]MBO6812712.1 TRAP transporter large permease [Marinobacter sp.]MBO6873874.1 TRAP transporter large permease [Marinobacter sp.]
MDTGSLVLLITLLMAVFFAIGVPVVLCMGVWATSVLYFTEAMPIMNIGQGAFFGLSSFALLAMPLFILTGDLVREGGIARRFITLSKAMLARLPARLPVSTLGASAMFSAISGSNAATTATLGRMMIPSMVEERAPTAFAAAVTAAGGTLGIMIPPSLIMIVYGVLMNVSPSDLFIAGLLPGLLMVVGMVLITVFIGWKKGWTAPVEKEAPVSVWKAAWDAKSGAGAMVIGLGGIYAGIFSPTEAAGIAAAYCLIIGVFLTKELKVGKIGNVLFSSGAVAGIIAPIVAFAMVIQEVVTVLSLQDAIWEFVLGFASSPLAILGIAMIAVLIFGCVLESIPNIIILAPIFAPLAIDAGVDPIHFAIVFVMGSTIGFITPPYGLNLFVASSVSGASIFSISRAVLPYLVMLIIVWIIVALVPSISLFLL